MLYAGTFNKIMFPSLRLAFLVAPPGLVEALALARSVGDGPVAALAQAAMADFLAGGHFAAHVRAMRALFEERRDALLDGVARELPGRLSILPAETGTHAVGWLPPGRDDAEVSRRGRRERARRLPLSRAPGPRAAPRAGPAAGRQYPSLSASASSPSSPAPMPSISGTLETK